MFRFLNRVAAVTYNFLDMFSLYTAVFTLGGAWLLYYINGGDTDE